MIIFRALFIAIVVLALLSCGEEEPGRFYATGGPEQTEPSEPVEPSEPPSPDGDDDTLVASVTPTPSATATPSPSPSCVPKGKGKGKGKGGCK